MIGLEGSQHSVQLEVDLHPDEPCHSVGSAKYPFRIAGSSFWTLHSLDIHVFYHAHFLLLRYVGLTSLSISARYLTITFEGMHTVLQDLQTLTLKYDTAKFEGLSPACWQEHLQSCAEYQDAEVPM